VWLEACLGCNSTYKKQKFRHNADVKLPEQPTTVLIRYNIQSDCIKNANTTHKGAITTSLKKHSTDIKLPEQTTTTLIRSDNQPNQVKKCPNDN
jgi:hypothetical protein